MKESIHMDPGPDNAVFEVGNEPLCLEFVNTVDDRKGSHPYDYFTNYPNLAAWAFQSGLLSEAQARALLRQAEADPGTAEIVLRRARGLRDAIYRLVSAHAAGLPMQPEDIEQLNRELPAAYRHLQLVSGEEHLGWEWSPAPNALDAFLWPVVRSAADLLTSPDLERTGECDNPTCGWLFLDTSKNHSRRWCDMASCGNTAKARSFYQRQKKKQEKKRAHE